ncbi:MAG: FmdB family zinc ribbon protein [Comamonas sp.]
MPIYAYKCGACGFAKDVLQKVSDAPITQCPSCGEAHFSKQLTAPGFQLKGTGWYATDFSGKAKAPAAAPTAAPAAGAAGADAAAPAPAPAPAAAPAASA